VNSVGFISKTCLMGQFNCFFYRFIKYQYCPFGQDLALSGLSQSTLKFLLLSNHLFSEKYHVYINSEHNF